MKIGKFIAAAPSIYLASSFIIDRFSKNENDFPAPALAFNVTALIFNAVYILK
jgi:hypothetical protein